MSSEAHDAKRAELQKAWNEKYGKNAPKPAPVAIPGSNFVIDAQWENIPGEGNFKFIKSTSGKETASIKIRDGFYMLGARDEAGGFVHFQENMFISEDEAVDYLKRNEKLLRI